MAEPGEGFERFLEQELTPFIEQGEAERRRVLRKALTRGLPVLALGGTGFVFGFLGGTAEDVSSLVQFGSFAALAIGGALLTTPLARWSRDFAAALSARIFDHFGYRYSADVPTGFLDAFSACRLLPSHDRHSLEDHVQGKARGVPFELAEATLERRVRRDKRDDYDLVFRGLLARYHFPKHFAGRTILRGDQGMFNALGHAGVPGERVRLEDVRFEKLFEVFSTDQVEARYLLTPAFMERFVALAERVRAPMEAAFEGNELLLAINGRRGYFSQPSPWRDLRRSDHLRAFVEDIALIGEIAETLKLDAVTRV